MSNVDPEVPSDLQPDIPWPPPHPPPPPKPPLPPPRILLASEVFDVNANGNAVGGRHPRADIPSQTTRLNGNRIVTLRGWLLAFGDPPGTENPSQGLNGGDPDWHSWFAPDVNYLLNDLKVDIGQFVKLGDIIRFGLASVGGGTAAGDPWVTVARPAIHVELDGWAVRWGPGNVAPYGWVEIPSDRESVWWAFDPRIDPTTQKNWQDLYNDGGGIPYVEISGSLVTDEPHYAPTGPGYVSDVWTDGQDNHDPNNPGRWTEIHSPDYIRTVPEPGDSNMSSLVGIALCSPAVAVEEKFDGVVWSFGPGSFPAGQQPIIDEFVGAESDLGTLTTGNPGRTGADISTSIGPDGSLNISLSAGVTAQVNRVGKFKAVYHLRWN